MEQNKLHLYSVIESDDKYNGKTVAELTEKKGVIFKMLKKGYQFVDEVLAKSRIKKTIRDEKIDLIISNHAKDTKTYKKETASVKDIIKEIEVLDYDEYELLDYDEYEEKFDITDVQNEEKLFINGEE